MPLILYFSPAFERSLKTLGTGQRSIAAAILKCLQAYYTHDSSISKAKEYASGFFYKQLRKPYCEAGIESNVRIVLRRERQKCIAMLAGNHDQIRQFLRNV